MGCNKLNPPTTPVVNDAPGLFSIVFRLSLFQWSPPPPPPPPPPSSCVDFLFFHYNSLLVSLSPPPNCFLEESWRARCCVNIEPVVPQPLGSTCWPRPWGMGWVRALLEPGIGFRNRPADITGPGPWGMVARKGCRTRSGSTGAWVKHRVGFGN